MSVSSKLPKDFFYRFIILFLSMLILTTSAFFAVYYYEYGSLLKITKSNETAMVKFTNNIVARELMDVIADLTIQSSHHELKQFLSGRNQGFIDPFGVEIKVLSEAKSDYDQIRLIDKSGKELVRVNYNDGNPSLVDEENLQDKSDRPYFKETMRLEKGRFYLSDFDLNVEHGEIEIPFKPVIRLAAPLFDNYGEKAGIMIINYLTDTIFDFIRNQLLDHHGYLMLVNMDGYWIVGMDPEDEWGFLLKDRSEKKFSVRFQNSWEIIKQSNGGQFRNDKGLFTYQTLSPTSPGSVDRSGKPLDEMIVFDEGAQYKSWKLISFIPSESLGAGLAALKQKLILAYAFSALFLLLGSRVFANLLTNRKEAEHTLETLSARLRLAVESGEIGIWDYDVKNNILIWDHRMYGLYGVKKEDFSGAYDAWQKGLHPDDKEDAEEKLQMALVGKADFDHEFRVVFPNGDIRYIQAHAMVLWDENAKAKRMIGINYDITNQKKAEAELKKYAETQAVLLREVNHRVKNNLAAIISMIHKEEERAVAENIESYLPVLRDLIGRVGGLSMVHSILSQGGWQPIALTELCKKIIQGALQGVPLDKKVNLTISASDVLVNSTQAHHLTLVINELATNVVKHGLNNRDIAAINVEIAVEGENITLKFKDDGPGFPVEFLDGDFRKANIGFELIGESFPRVWTEKSSLPMKTAGW